jgi:spermidine synthase
MAAGASLLGLLLAMPALASPGLPNGARVVHVERGAFGGVFVVDQGDVRFLRFGRADGDDQSAISLADPDAVPMEYLRYAAAGLAFVDGRRRALVVGLGGGAFPMLLARRFPGMAVHAVDVDPVVVSVARRFFGLRPGRRLAVTVKDAAAFLAADPTRWDFVLLDAYGPGGIPDHLTTPRFFARVRARLAPGGAAVINVAADSDDTESRIVAAFAGAFPGCVLLRTPQSDNVIAVGLTNRPRQRSRSFAASPPPLPTRQDIALRLRALAVEARFSFPVAAAADMFRPC